MLVLVEILSPKILENIVSATLFKITILNASPLTTRIIIAFLCMPIYLCCCLFTVVTLQNMNFVHTKLIIVFWCHHISCWAFIYSHFTSLKKVKKVHSSTSPNIVDILLGVLFLWYHFPVHCRFIP